MTWAATHVCNGSLQKYGKEFFFFWGESLQQSGFIELDGLVHGLVTFLPLGLNVDSFAAPVIGIGLKPDKSLLFQAGQDTGYCGVAQVKGFFHIPWAGRLGLPG